MSKLMIVNPSKRKKRRKSPAAKKAKGIRRRRRVKAIGGVAGTAFKNGAIGSAGAIAGTIAGNFLPLPENLKTGPVGSVVDAVIGIGTGMLVSKFGNKNVGLKMAEGAVTVALHGTMKNIVSKAAPQLNLSGYDDYGMSAYDDDYMGAYDDGFMGARTAGYTGEDEWEDDSDTIGDVGW